MKEETILNILLWTFVICTISVWIVIVEYELNSFWKLVAVIEQYILILLTFQTYDLLNAIESVKNENY